MPSRFTCRGVVINVSRAIQRPPDRLASTFRLRIDKFQLLAVVSIFLEVLRAR